MSIGSSISNDIVVTVRTNDAEARARLEGYKARLKELGVEAGSVGRLAAQANRLQEQSFRQNERAAASFRKELDNLARSANTIGTKGPERIEALRKNMLATATQANATAVQIDKINASFDKMLARQQAAERNASRLAFNKEVAGLDSRVSSFGVTPVQQLEGQRKEMLALAGHANITAASLDKVNSGFDTLIRRQVELEKQPGLRAFNQQLTDLGQRASRVGQTASGLIEVQRKEFLALARDVGATVPQIDKINRSFDTLAAQAAKSEQKIGLLRQKLGNFANVAASVATGIIVAEGLQAVFSTVQQIEERAQRLSQLGAVLPIVARTAGVTQQQLAGVERAILGMNLAAVEAKQILATGLAAGLPVGSLVELTEAGRNLSVVMGGDIPTAVDRLVGAIVKEEVEILETAGLLIKFQRGYDDLAASLGKTSNQLTEQEKLIARYKQVVDAAQSVTGAFAGSVESSGTQAALAATEWKNLIDLIGKGADPVLADGYRTLRDLLQELNDIASNFQASSDLRALFERAGVGLPSTLGGALKDAALGPVGFLPEVAGAGKDYLAAYYRSLPGGQFALDTLGNPFLQGGEAGRKAAFEQFSKEGDLKLAAAARKDAEAKAQSAIKAASDGFAAEEARRKAAEEAARKLKALTPVRFDLDFARSRQAVLDAGGRIPTGGNFDLVPGTEYTTNPQRSRTITPLGEQVGTPPWLRPENIRKSFEQAFSNNASNLSGEVRDLALARGQVNSYGELVDTAQFDPISSYGRLAAGQQNDRQKQLDKSFETNQERIKRAFEEAQRQGEKTFNDLKRISNDWIRDLIINGESFWSVFKQAGLTAFSDIASDVTARGLFNLFGGQSPGDAIGGLLFGGAGFSGLGSISRPGAPGGTGGFAGPYSFSGLSASQSYGASTALGGGGAASFFGGGAGLGLAGALPALAGGYLGSQFPGGRAAKAGIAGGATIAGGVIGGAALGGAGLASVAALGAFLSNPVGIAVLAGAIAIPALIGAFTKSGKDKAKQKIKGVYGIEVDDDKVLDQVVGAAKSNFGGSIDVAIHSPGIRELLLSYNLSKGGDSSGFGNYPRGISITQRSGRSFIDPAYQNGTPFTYAGNIPTAPVSVNRQVSVIQIDNAGVAELLATGTKKVIANEPRLVQQSTQAALGQSSGRRENTVLTLEPYAI